MAQTRKEERDRLEVIVRADLRRRNERERDQRREHAGEDADTPGGGEGITVDEDEVLAETNHRMPSEDRIKEKAKRKGNLWIMKPAKSSRGRGIYVVSDIGDISYGELSIIQNYIHQPLLLDNIKWDIRIYVLVTSFQPQLEAYVYKSGFGRFATVKYTTEDLSTLIHLTNTSIQRHSAANDHSKITDHESQSKNGEGASGGSNGGNNSMAPGALGSCLTAQESLIGGTKIDLNALARKLKQSHNLNFWESMWPKMVQVVLKSLACAAEHIQPSPNSFEIFGYDLIFDAALNCWLIEVNSSPSLGVEHLLDESVKGPLISDTIDLINPQSFDRAKMWKVLERRGQKAVSGRGAHLTGINGGTQNVNIGSNQLNIDLAAVLGKESGNEPKKLGNYEQIAPSPAWTQICKLKSQLFHTKDGK